METDWQKTQRLNAEMYDALGVSFIGTLWLIIALVCMLFSGLLISDGKIMFGLLAMAGGVAAFAVCVWLKLPWLRALSAVEKHTEEMRTRNTQ